MNQRCKLQVPTSHKSHIAHRASRIVREVCHFLCQGRVHSVAGGSQPRVCVVQIEEKELLNNSMVTRGLLDAMCASFDESRDVPFSLASCFVNKKRCVGLRTKPFIQPKVSVSSVQEAVEPLSSTWPPKCSRRLLPHRL